MFTYMNSFLGSLPFRSPHSTKESSLCCTVGSHLFFVVQSLSCVQHFATPWTPAHQASLSFPISWSLLKLMSMESVILSNHLILCCPLFPPVLSLSQHQGLFQWASSSHHVASIGASASESVFPMNIQS